MTNVCLYFQVHQPFRIQKYTIFDIGKSSDYFDNKKNQEIMQKVAKKCYLPANKLLRDLIATNENFKVAFSMSGTAIQQFQKYAPAVLDSFEDLISTGAVELLNETSHHSLAGLQDVGEFCTQVRDHQKIIKGLFGKKPTVFRNTELILTEQLAQLAKDFGYKAVLAEGADKLLRGKSPNFVYRPENVKKIKLLLKNYSLSDDIAFRYSKKLKAKNYAKRIASQAGDSINLFMDYETFGEHHWKDTGILTFLGQLPNELAKLGISFHWPSEVAQNDPVEAIEISQPTSWADMARDTSAWLGNKMQQAAAAKLYSLRGPVLRKNDAALTEAWRRLSTSDHFYYMSTKHSSDGAVHRYFNPHGSPYEAHIAFMNILNDLQARTKRRFGWI